MKLSRYRAATRISRVICAEMAGERPRQLAYEIFAISPLHIGFSSLSFNPLRLQRPAHASVEEGHFF